MLVQTGYQCVGLGWDFKWLANSKLMFRNSVVCRLCAYGSFCKDFWAGNGFNWYVVMVGV